MILLKDERAHPMHRPYRKRQIYHSRAMIDRINSERYEHIITVEDPIEYLHSHKKCLINQREVMLIQIFKDALRYVLRQDPDVVLIGEMRTSRPLKLLLRYLRQDI